MGDIRDAFDAAVEANPLVRPEDGAAVALGERLASHLDVAFEELDGQEQTKALYLAPHLVNVLKELGATPAARADLAKKAATAKSTAGASVAQADDEVGAKRQARGWRSA